MSKEAIATYDFDDEAIGLANFIIEAWNDKTIHDDEITVNVEDAHGNPAKVARLVRETLTDGSTVVNLVIDFHFT